MEVNKSSRRASIQLRAKQPRLPNACVLPADFWYGKMDGAGKYWCDTLGPSATAPLNTVKQYDTQPLPGDKLQITINLQGDLGSAHVTASLRNWKVLSADEKLKTKGRAQRFTYLYTWNEDGRKLDKLVFRVKDGERPSWEKVYQVKMLDVGKRPDVGRFEIDEGKLPPGYFIDNKITKRRYWKDNVNTDLNAALQGMVGEVRSSGFLLHR
jgi:hypothetical protein